MAYFSRVNRVVRHGAIRNGNLYYDSCVLLLNVREVA